GDGGLVGGEIERLDVRRDDLLEGDVLPADGILGVAELVGHGVHQRRLEALTGGRVLPHVPGLVGGGGADGERPLGAGVQGAGLAAGGGAAGLVGLWTAVVRARTGGQRQRQSSSGQQQSTTTHGGPFRGQRSLP